MTSRKIVAQELSKLFSALSHPDRIRIIEELGSGELDVQSLSELLEVSSSRVSQHLSILRSLRMVSERREGKHHFYSLTDQGVAKWILEGVAFSELGLLKEHDFSKAVRGAKKKWSS